MPWQVGVVYKSPDERATAWAKAARSRARSDPCLAASDAVVRAQRPNDLSRPSPRISSMSRRSTNGSVAERRNPARWATLERGSQHRASGLQDQGIPGL